MQITRTLHTYAQRIAYTYTYESEFRQHCHVLLSQAVQVLLMGWGGKVSMYMCVWGGKVSMYMCVCETLIISIICWCHGIFSSVIANT